MQQIKFKNLKKEYQKLILEAEKSLKNAYAPYSHFFVGAALLTRKGRIITGANIENISYGLSLCAERAAIGRAITLGEKQFRAIGLIAKGKGFEEIISPCGACRQTLYEFSQIADIDLDVVMSNTKKSKIIVAKISEILPLAFGPKNLGTNF